MKNIQVQIGGLFKRNPYKNSLRLAFQKFCKQKMVEAFRAGQQRNLTDGKGDFYNDFDEWYNSEYK